MFLIGDIGNTEVKIVLFNKKNIILKKILLKTDKINENYINPKSFYTYYELDSPPKEWIQTCITNKTII